MPTASPDGAGSINPRSRAGRTAGGGHAGAPDVAQGPTLVRQLSEPSRSPHRCRWRVKAHSHSSAALLPPVGWFDWSGPGRSRLFVLPDRSDPEPRVIHEAGGRSQDGSVQEAVEGEETDPGGADPAVPASSAAHPPHEREYSDAPVDPRHL